jgi:hypothetical protein
MTSNKKNPNKGKNEQQKPRWGQGDKRLIDKIVASIKNKCGIKVMTNEEPKKVKPPIKWGEGNQNLSDEIKKGQGQEKKPLWVSRDLEDKSK